MHTHAHHEGLQWHFREKVRPVRGTQWLSREKARPTRPIPQQFREKVRPTHLKTAFFGHFGLAGRTFSRSQPLKAEQGELFRAHTHSRPRRANFFALAATQGRAGRTFSRTGYCHVPTSKPTTPMLAPNKDPLKPASPLHGETAPKTPISRPQRRWRFQSRLGQRPQRRSRFQTTGPPGRQRLTATPWAATTPPPPNFACNSIG